MNGGELRELIDEHPEWLLVRERGRSFPIQPIEIDIDGSGAKTHFGFVDDEGYHSWRLNGFQSEAGEITIDVAGAFGRNQQSIKLIPRKPAADLTAELHDARERRANEIADLVRENVPGARIQRVALSSANGRLVQILYELPGKVPAAALSDVTIKMTAESILSAALPWFEALRQRKKPVARLLIVAERKQARNLQKLHALLAAFYKERLAIVEIDRKADPALLRELPPRAIRELWREKARALVLPKDPEPSATAQQMITSAPDSIDHLFSRNGETLRFNGLPFARIRSLLNSEKVWVGTEREMAPVEPDINESSADLMNELKLYRTHASPNKRHRLYRAAPEAWLESILRRNIQLLDANLILSPIYNQFRSSNDKIDLLAIRRDGRLVIIELKTQPDRAAIFQAADYWRKIELQRRRGILAAADLFGGREILDRPALVYIAAPAWSFHRDFEFFARAISPEIEIWRFELHENWRSHVRVLARHSYTDGRSGTTNL